MQKLEIKENFSKLFLALFTTEILEIINSIRKENLQQGTYNELKANLTKWVIESKSNFDNTIKDNKKLQLITSFFNVEIYFAENLTKLIAAISSFPYANRDRLYSTRIFLDFHTFHKTVLNMYEITNSIITESQEAENVIMFTIVSKEFPKIDLIIEVLEIIKNLISSIEDIYNEKTDHRIYLLDTGSNTNIGVESGTTVVKVLFDIFKEIWIWMINRKHYKQKLKNTEFLNDLIVIEKIHEMVKSGVLTEEDGARFKEEFIRDVNSLLSNNTVPRKLLLEENTQSNQQSLLDYNEIRLLEKG